MLAREIVNDEIKALAPIEKRTDLVVQSTQPTNERNEDVTTVWLGA